MLFVLLVTAGLGLVLMPYVVAPLVVRLTHKQAAAPPFERVDFDTFPEDAREFFRRSAAALAARGFEPAACVRGADPAARTVMHILVMTCEPASESAAVCDLRGTTPRVRLGERFVEFCTEFVNGQEIDTHNCRVEFVTKPDPRKTVFRFPSLANPLLLHDAHRQLVERHAPASGRFLQTRGTEHLHLSHASERWNRLQEEFGYLYLDADAGVYRPTLKGACLMTWKLLWPVKQGREVLARRRAAGTLRALRG